MVLPHEALHLIAAAFSEQGLMYIRDGTDVPRDGRARLA